MHVDAWSSIPTAKRHAESTGREVALFNIRSIVVASDLSAPARRAVDRAAMLARRASASLTLAHVVTGSALDDVRRWLDVGADPGQSIIDDARTRLHELAAGVARDHGVAVDERTLIGRPADELARLAEDVDADVIVTGTLGGGFVRSRLVGATAERLVRKSMRPVLMVRQSPRAPYRRVIVAIDFSRWSEASLRMAADMAPEADFVLLHCIVPLERMAGLGGVDAAVVERNRATARDEAARHLQEFATRAGLDAARWSVAIRTGMPPWTEIVRLEQEQDCDLIVVGKHGVSEFEDLLLGSTTNTVIAESSADVLIFTRAIGGSGADAKR